VAVFVGFLARHPDSHIQRKHGAARAAWVTERMRELEARLKAPGPLARHRDELREIDRDFKLRGVNPGTSADLTVATLLAAALRTRYPAHGGADVDR
jgi:triphosphoribosyl-dephospho-CoA synthase